MFSGIVQHVGVVDGTHRGARGGAIVVVPSRWTHRPEPGESVAVNGCCLTLIASADGPGGPALRFDLVEQTLKATALGSLRRRDRVNLEHPVTPATMLSGHIVQGHVDGVGRVTGVSPVSGDYRLRIAPPAALLEYIVERGSIAVDGVSLTVAGVDAGSFEVALIPTTLACTTLGDLREGSAVNLECDYLAKIVVAWLQRRAGSSPMVPPSPSAGGA
jgi:riboflavin synthase